MASEDQGVSIRVAPATRQNGWGNRKFEALWVPPLRAPSRRFVDDMLAFHAEPTDDSYGYVCDRGETLIGSGARIDVLVARLPPAGRSLPRGR